MDQYSKSAVVGRGATKATPELGEKLFGMVVEEFVSMIQKDHNEEKPKQHHNNDDKSSNATKKGSNETMSKKTQAYIITNIGALLAMIVVVINMFTLSNTQNVTRL
jgi:hypothetical protein